MVLENLLAGGALAAQRAHAGLVVLRPDELARAIELALSDDVARMLRARARALVPDNGARTAAACLRQVVGAPSAAPTAHSASAAFRG